MKRPVMPWSGMGYEIEWAAKWPIIPWNGMGYEMASNALEWNGL